MSHQLNYILIVYLGFKLGANLLSAFQLIQTNTNNYCIIAEESGVIMIFNEEFLIPFMARAKKSIELLDYDPASQLLLACSYKANEINFFKLALSETGEIQEVVFRSQFVFINISTAVFGHSNCQFLFGDNGGNIRIINIHNPEKQKKISISKHPIDTIKLFQDNNLDNFEEEQNTHWLQKTAPSFTKLGESLKMCLDQNFQADKSINTMLGNNQEVDSSDEEQQKIDESLVCEDNELDIEINPIVITEIIKIENKNQKEKVQNKLSIITEEEEWNLELSSKQ